MRGVLWNGKNIIIPQASSRVDSSGLNPVNLGGANRLAILGTMVGLIEPGKATKIDNPALAQMLIHPDSAEARLAAQLVFTPSPGSGANGASEVYLIPVNPATQASHIFDNVLKLTSFMFGIPANQVRAKIAAGSTAGKKITVEYQGNTEIFDNLTKSSFTIQYTGDGSAATLDIDVSAAVHNLATTCTGATGDNLDIDLNAYPSIQALVDAIQANGKYTCTILASRPKVDKSLQLDTVVGQAIKVAAYTVKSDLQACVEGVNSSYCRASRVVDAGTVPANVATWTYLAEGSNGTVTNNTWQAAFDLMKTMSMDLLVPLSADAAIHAMADAHAIYMSGPSGKQERRVFVGGALQSWVSESDRSSSVASLLAAIKLLNSDRTMHACLGSYHYDQDGVSTLYPAYITACMYAGIAAGSSPTYPLTRKYIRCLGLEVDLRISEIETLIQGGGAAPIPDLVLGNGWTISQQLTTWLQSDDLYRIEFSVGRGADYIAMQVRRRHELMIGLEGTPNFDRTVINITNAVLEEAKRNGYINDYDAKATTLRANGTYRYIDYSATPVLPVNGIFSTYHLQPTSYTITL